jgi:hypothetical protein
LLARADLRPPPFAVLISSCLALALGLALSPVGDRFARGLPLAWLVLAQAFRLPLECVMHEAAREGTMPVEMSFAGYNFDIVTGASACLVGPWLHWRRGGLAHPRAGLWLVWIWNLVGSVLLAIIVGLAVAASPVVRAFGDDPAHVNTWVAHFPFVWLPAVLVVAALFGHVVVFRALSRSS